MKKILIASTALVAAGFISTSTASASEKIKLELGGYSKWWVVGQWNQTKYQNASTSNPANVDVKGDNEIFFSGETTLNNGMKVGINVELEAGGANPQSTSNSQNGGDTIDQSFVYVSGNFGKVIAGTHANGTVLLHSMAPDAAGNWGSENVALYSIAQPGNVSLRATTEIDTDDNAEKITYVAPTFYGLTVGASYIPSALSEDNRGAAGNTTVAGVALGTNVRSDAPAYGVGAQYANEFGPVGVKISGGWVTYDLGLATKNNQNEWSTGTQITYGGFTLGGSYRGINTDSTALNAVALSNGRVWDAGLQYASGPYAISFTTLQSVSQGDVDHGSDKLAVYQLSGKYSMGPGVDALASVSHVAYDSNENGAGGATDNDHNKGIAVMTGLSLAF